MIKTAFAVFDLDSDKADPYTNTIATAAKVDVESGLFNLYAI